MDSETQHGFHVTNSPFAWLLHSVHGALSPLCEATAEFDAAHAWAPCSAAKLLVLVAVHVLGFLLLQRCKAGRPAVQKKTAVDLASECTQPAAGASSSVRAPDAAGLSQRKQ